MTVAGNTPVAVYSAFGQEASRKAQQAAAHGADSGQSREALKDAFVSIQKDARSTADEKTLAKLGQALGASTELSDRAAVAAGLAVMSAISSGIQAPIGAVIAHAITAGEYRSLTWGDVRDILKRAYDSIAADPRTTGVEKAIAETGKVICGSDVTDQTAGNMGYILLGALPASSSESPEKALGTILSSDVVGQLEPGEGRTVMAAGFGLLRKRSQGGLKKIFNGVNGRPDASPAEKELTALGSTLLADSSLYNKGAFAVARAISKGLAGSLSGPVGPAIAQVIMGGDFSLCTWDDYRIITGEALKSIGNSPGISEVDRAFAEAGDAVYRNSSVSCQAAGTMFSALLRALPGAESQPAVKALSGIFADQSLSGLSDTQLRYLFQAGFDVIAGATARKSPEGSVAQMGKSVAGNEDLGDTGACTAEKSIAGLLAASSADPVAIALAVSQGNYQSISWSSLREIMKETFSCIQSHSQSTDVQQCLATIGISLMKDTNSSSSDAGNAGYILLKAIAQKNRSLTDLLATADYSAVTGGMAADLLTRGFAVMEGDSKSGTIEKHIAQIARLATRDEYMSGNSRGSICLALISALQAALNAPAAPAGPGGPAASPAMVILKTLSAVDYSAMTAGNAGKILREGFALVEKESRAGGFERAFARIARVATADPYMSEEAAGKTLQTLLAALPATTTGALSDELVKALSNGNYSAVSYKEAGLLLKEAFAIMEESPRSSDIQKSIARIARASTSDPYLNSELAGRMEYLLMQALAHNSESAVWLAVAKDLGNADYSKLTWGNLRALYREGFSAINSDSTAPQEVKTLATRGFDICKDTSQGDQQAGSEAFKIMQQITGLISRQEEAKEEIRKMADAVTGQNEPQENIVADAEFVSIGGIRLEVKKEK